MGVTRLSASKARGEFKETLSRVEYGKERIILRRHHKDAVAVVPIEDLKLIQAIEDKLDRKALRAARSEPGSIPWAKVKEELGL
jgi:prevent-host-death family protein